MAVDVHGGQVGRIVCPSLRQWHHVVHFIRGLRHLALLAVLAGAQVVIPLEDLIPKPAPRPAR